MAVGFFALLSLLSIADLSFAIPATAGSYMIETILAKWSSGGRPLAAMGGRLPGGRRSGTLSLP